MEGLIAKLIAGFGLAMVLTVAFRLMTSRRASRLLESTKVDVAAWRGWAESSGYNFTGNDARPTISGAVRGVPFRLACDIKTIRIQARGVTQERKIARTSMRASMRTSLPDDLFMHPMPRLGRFMNKLLGGKTIEMIPALDATHATETDQPDKARKILLDPTVKPHLGRVVTLIPEAIIDARSIEATFPGMPTMALELDRYVETLADLVLAVQEVAPGKAIAAPIIDPLAAEGSEAKAIVSSAQLPKRRPILAHALAKVERNPNEAGMVGLHPYEYTVQMHLVKTGIDEKGRETGGKLVAGDVARSVWRVELLFEPEDTEAVEALEFGSFIEGMLEILDIDVRRKKVLAKSMTPPMPSTNPPSIG